MTAETIMQEIEKLPPHELDKLAGLLAEIESAHNRDAARRDQEIEAGSVKPLGEEEMRQRFGSRLG